MSLFTILGEELNYKDELQRDGAFSVTHNNYGKSPMFNGVDGKIIAEKSRENSLSSYEKVEDVVELIHSFNGTEKNFDLDDKISLWESYWMEYVNAFSKLVDILPRSITTIFIGRQAIEIGFKYLLIKKSGDFKKTHDLGELASSLFDKYGIKESYMEDVDSFCELFCKYIEGGNSEYFRYPEYNNNEFFAGNRLDIEWLSYNFAMIVLKLIHFAGLDTER